MPEERMDARRDDAGRIADTLGRFDELLKRPNLTAGIVVAGRIGRILKGRMKHPGERTGHGRHLLSGWIYFPGRFGVRIEDILIVTDGGARRTYACGHDGAEVS